MQCSHRGMCATKRLFHLLPAFAGLFIPQLTCLQCLASLNKKNAFCAAGETLSVWTSCGKLLTKLDRTEEEGTYARGVRLSSCTFVTAIKPHCLQHFLRSNKTQGTADKVSKAFNFSICEVILTEF